MPRVRGRSNASFSMSQSIDADDPLSRALQPPPDESPGERDERIRAEREAKRVSDEIDDQLRKERAALKKKRPVRVLLLGQSESGKSTTLKNFQIHYAPQSWREERACWRAVIQLNLIRSVSLVLDTVATAPPPWQDTPPKSSDVAPGALVERYVPLLARLAIAERILQRRLSPNDNEEAGDYRSFTVADTSSPLMPSPSVTNNISPSSISPTHVRPSGQEFFVRTSGAFSWKSRFMRHLSPATSPSSQSPSSPSIPLPKYSNSAPSSPSTDYPLRVSIDFRGNDAQPLENNPNEEPTSPTQILHAALPEMRSLWSDQDIRAALDRAGGSTSTTGRGGPGHGQIGRIKVEDTPGFFLNDVDRVASRGYEPSDDDVIRARLRTMGIQEHRFTFERGVDSGREWRIFDVGGARSQRTSWLSFFDDMDAIIFLAPISCFDETLVEDRRVNRLEDSITLWRSLCRSPLLSKVQLVLFLNKVDLLRRKIASGVRIARHVTSFGDRSNDIDTVCKYFKQKFKEIQRQYSPEPRPYYGYFTSVTDTRATGVTLGIVREGILRTNLQKADFL